MDACDCALRDGGYLEAAAFEIIGNVRDTELRTSSARTLDENSNLYQAALRALTRRAHSVHEMRDLLERRSDDEDGIDAVIDKLKRQKYLDDARYALDFARFRTRSRKQGKFRIARDLRARGVPDRHVQSALAAVSEETDEAAAIRARLQRVLKSKVPLNERKVASIYRSLLRAGYSADAIRTELRAARKGTPPHDSTELPDWSESDSPESD